MVAHHRGHIRGPHLFVGALNGRNQRRVQPEPIRHHQLRKRIAVGRHQQRVHRRRPCRLERAGHRLGLGRRPRGPGRRSAQPSRIRCRRRRHRRRRRPLPRLTCQVRGHRPKRGRRGPQLCGQPVPGHRRRQHRRRTCTREHPQRIKLRRQYRIVHDPVPSRPDNQSEPQDKPGRTICVSVKSANQRCRQCVTAAPLSSSRLISSAMSMSWSSWPPMSLR